MEAAAGSTLVEDPTFKQRFSFSRADDDLGEVLDIETWVDPGGGVTPHMHPAMEERFEVLEGNPSFLAGRKWRTASPGETVVVPAGVRHAYRNESDAVVHMVCHARPPSSLQKFLEEVAALSRAGKLTRFGIPMPSALLEAAAMAERHRDMVVLMFPMPPRPVQRAIFPVLARLHGRGKGSAR